METLSSSCGEKGERYFSRRIQMALNKRYFFASLSSVLMTTCTMSVYVIDIADGADRSVLFFRHAVLLFCQWTRKYCFLHFTVKIVIKNV